MTRPDNGSILTVADQLSVELADDIIVGHEVGNVTAVILRGKALQPTRERDGDKR